MTITSYFCSHLSITTLLLHVIILTLFKAKKSDAKHGFPHFLSHLYLY
jgi:hypothetical protein